jgi:hypothetical protein
MGPFLECEPDRAESPQAQSTGLQPCDYGRSSICDLKGREKFSHREQLRSATSRDLSGRTFCLISVHRAEALCFVLVGFQPTGMTRFETTEMPTTRAVGNFKVGWDQLASSAGPPKGKSKIHGGPARRNAAGLHPTSCPVSRRHWPWVRP